MLGWSSRLKQLLKQNCQELGHELADAAAVQMKVSGANLCTGLGKEVATSCTTSGGSLGVDEVAEKVGQGAEVETCKVLPKMTLKQSTQDR